MLVSCLLFVLQASAQEVLVSDSGLIAPFEGVIGYRIKYTGKIAPSMLAYLPDSMTLFVGKNGMLYRYEGGLRTLQTQLVWDGDVQEFWLLDSLHQTADSRSGIWKGALTTPKKLEKEPAVKIAGHPTVAYLLLFDKQVEKLGEKVWVNDSIRFGGQLVDTLKLQQPAFLAAGLRQIPLQTRRVHAGEIITTMTAVTITPGAQSTWLFKVPEAYRLQEFDPSRPWHPVLEQKKGE